MTEITKVHHVPAAHAPFWFPQILEGIERVCEEDDIHSVEEVLNGIRSGQFALWTVSHASDLKGFVLTNVLETGKTRYVNIFMTYLDPRKQNGVDHLKEGLASLEEQIVDSDMGFNGVSFYSSRPGFKRRMARLGYAPRLVEYYKELTPKGEIPPEEAA